MVCLWLAACNCPAQVLLVLSDDTAPYREVADAFRAEVSALRDGTLKVATASVRSLRDGSASLAGYELIVPIGLSAAEAALARDKRPPSSPVLCLLIPRQSFEALAWAQGVGRDGRISAVYIDQPFARQLDLIRAALPDRSRLGVIVGPTSAALADELREKARERDLAVSLADVSDSAGVYAALQKVLPQADMLLALPDPIAFNATTAYGLLLASYHAQVPVIGFSDGLVKAGALLALFSTAAQQGSQGGEIAAKLLSADARLSPPQHPRYFTVRVNASVARSLGLRLPDEQSLMRALVEREIARSGAGPRESPPSSGRAP
jgi:ABC-type uncharacterized transport system substrate-binding protein